jgi:glutathione reductase (NADPH)
MFNTAVHAERLIDLPDYGFQVERQNVVFDYAVIKQKRDAYLRRLNMMYEDDLERVGLCGAMHSRHFEPQCI